MPEADIKNEMINACNESWLLFFEKKIDRFIKRYEMKKAYTDYKKYCEEEGYNVFSNKTGGLRFM
jgi:tRNA 2-selenouridine synthase SelU